MQLSFQIGSMLALGSMFFFFCPSGLMNDQNCTGFAPTEKIFLNLKVYNNFLIEAPAKKSENCEKNILKIDDTVAENDIRKYDIDKY